MARRVKDQTLDSREARRKLKARGKPYYRSIERGLHLGYRKLKGSAGTWSARHYVGEQSYQVESIGVADDASDADGVAVLDFWQAQEKARQRLVERAHTAAGKTGPLTVGDAMDAYVEYVEANRKSVDDARYRDQAFIRPKLGDLEVSALTADRLRRWMVDLANAPARVRTRVGEAQQHRPLGRDAEARRRRQASVNRVWTTLRAALNHAWRDGKVASNAEWSRVKPFRDVDAARVRYLSVDEAVRLLNACHPDFRRLVQAALETGARYGELTALEVSDFNKDAGTLAIRRSKAGKPRHVVLTEEGIAFFGEVCKGRAGSETMLLKANGGAWGKSHQKPLIGEACKNASIKPAISFHGLRHSWASLAVMAGMPMMVVARNLGHADTRMIEKHYGHLAPSYVADAIRAGAPRFGFKPDKKIAALPTR
jgi:integrase